MKMVKSLLLGSAAGLVAVAGAQAADLPVKAKAVEYVKVCSLYGAGFYYIPGTDTCVKFGGYVRYEAYHNEPGGAFPTASAAGQMTRETNVWAQHARWRFTADVRSQTEYGTLRSYWSVGYNFHNTASGGIVTPATGSSVAFERAFIQFAGFTFGRSESMFAFYNGAAYGLTPTQYDASTGPAGIDIAAYTAQFGNGVSATLSLEDSQQRAASVLDLSSPVAPFTLATLATDRGAGRKTPDIVANIRVDQAWGSAQIMGALHQVGATYYTGAAINGHPGDEWGWAVGAGLTLKMPWDPRDTLSGQIAWAEGASKYVAAGVPGNHLLHKDGVAIGHFNDAVYANGTGLELTEAWGGTIAFEHYWTPSLRSSLVFAYLDVSYNGAAKGLIAAVAGCPAGTSCDPDWSAWRLGSRTMWNPVQNLDIGVEVFYSKINTAFAGNTLNFGPITGATVQDESVWTAAFRAQRNFWP